MAPRTRKVALTVHVVCSVGWLGAVLAFMALAIVGLISRDAASVRAAYIAMEPLTWFVLIPLSIASLLTGIVQSVGTPWGLLRHYWVLAKLVLNVVATTVLLLYTQTVGYLADVAEASRFPGRDPDLGNPSPLLHGAAAALRLLAATALAVLKPRGQTRFGQRARGDRAVS